VNAWSEARGVTVLKMVHDTKRPGDREAGPALLWALDRIAAGEADTLVVPSLQCLAPTVGTLPPLLRWFTDPHRTLVALDLDLDTATDAGRKAADALAGVGSWEQERLSAQTRRGLQAARSRGAGRAGAAVADVPELRERIVRMREQGMTLQAIADALNDEGVPTLRGGAEWRPSSVHNATGYRRPPSPRGLRPPAGPAGAAAGRR
jgi:DNA invertase Pin-like site-specific DNA recombinase